MPSSNRQDRARIGAETAAHVAAGKSASQEARDHIRSSRRAIERSFDLLSETSAAARSGHRP